jgi:hypothetical protein
MAEAYACRWEQLWLQPLPPPPVIVGIQLPGSREACFAEWEFALNVAQKSMAGRISVAARFSALRACESVLKGTDNFGNNDYR